MRLLMILTALFLTLGCQASLPIAIDSEPQGAAVTLDGRPYGKTPTTAEVIYNPWLGAPPNARLVLKKEGYVSSSFLIVPTPIGDGRAYWPDEKFIRLVPSK